MSRSRPDRLTILVCRRSVAILGSERLTIASEPALREDESIGLAFERLLEQHKPTSVLLVLSSSLVDALVIEKLSRWVKDDDLNAIGRSRLTKFYGKDQTGRHVAVHRMPRQLPSLAASVSQHVLDILGSVASRHQCEILGITPFSTYAIDLASRELATDGSSAIYAVDDDAIFVATSSAGAWRSARCIPKVAMGSSIKLQDVIRREALAAGLASVERVYRVDTGLSQPPGDRCAGDSDLSERLWSSTRPGNLSINFRASREHRAGWGVLLASVAASAFVAWSWSSTSSKLEAGANEIVEQTRLHAQQFAQANLESKALAAEYGRAFQSYRKQTVPWDRLILGLNDSANGRIVLTRFEADSTGGTAFVEGEGKDFGAVQSFADRLAVQPAFRQIKVLSALPVADDPEKSVRFGISFNWPSANVGGPQLSGIASK